MIDGHVVGRPCRACDPPGPGDTDGEGYLLDENGEALGQCHECGDDALLAEGCCPGAEIVPFVVH